MNTDFTISNQNSTFEYPTIDDIDDAMDYLRNPDSFRSFDKGLIELLLKKGYSGDPCNINELSEYLIKKLKEINSTIRKETIISWFSGEHSPKIEAGSRHKIYEICFALKLSYKETTWFFHHVYYDRAFNCHTIEEAVYYFSFLNNLTYQEAQEIISEIQKTPNINNPSVSFSNYTRVIQNCITDLKNVNELKHFLIENKTNFYTWNKSASTTLNNLITELIGSAESKSSIDKLKRIINQKKLHHANIRSLDLSALSDYQNCGLLIKELLFDSQNQCTDASSADYFLDAINNKNIRKNTFILERLLSTSDGVKKNPNIPYIVRNNFPSKKTLSDILSAEKISISKSYDSIRKVIVLLDFYRFWANVKLNLLYQELSKEDLYQIYIEEANHCLYMCGYEYLYAGNPYDWIFLCSAQNENPLDYFRSCIAEILS